VAEEFGVAGDALCCGGGYVPVWGVVCWGRGEAGVGGVVMVGAVKGRLDCDMTTTWACDDQSSSSALEAQDLGYIGGLSW
jgi:hypothetical protein